MLVRKNCEYSLDVEADSDEEALAKANAIPLSEWNQAWAPDEVESDGEEI